MILKNNIGIIIFLLLATFLNDIHCQDNERSILDKTTIFRLKGSYQIFSADRTSLLPACLINNYYFNFENKPDNNDSLTIEVINSNKIIISIFDNGEKIKTKEIKGKLENGYFYSNTLFISNFYLIFNVTARLRTRIGLLNNNHLIIDVSRTSMGFIFFIPFIGFKTESKDLEFYDKIGSS